MSELINSRSHEVSVGASGYSRAAISRAMGATVFYSLLVVIAFAAIPYGAAEPWWKAFVDCSIFLLAFIALIADLVHRPEATHAVHGRLMTPPLLALILFACFQTIPWSGTATAAGVVWQLTLSADVFETRVFVLHLSALILAGWLLVRHTTTPKRRQRLIEVVILIGVASAAFGLWRQTSQREVGFYLQYLRPGFGYAQFINPNHFAFLVEMVLGLTLGIVVCRGVKGARLLIYVLAAVPMWIALVLANSRGGLISLLFQSAFLSVLFVTQRAHRHKSGGLSSVKQSVAQIVLVTILLIGAITSVIMVGGDPLAGRIDSMSVELDSTTARSYTLRRNIWQATWALIKDHPVSGVGFGGYWVGISRYHRASGETTPQQAHNDYLELMASGGLIGLSIGLWFVAGFAWTAYRKLQTADRHSRAVTLGALAGILTIAVHSLVDFGLHIPINAFLCTTPVALAVSDVGKQ
jgi:O-antigen ligase